MSEQRLDSLDRAVSRLLQAQQEALEACEGVLDDQEILDDADELFDSPTPPVQEGPLYRAALGGTHHLGKCLRRRAGHTEGGGWERRLT
jgi:hypothetical protein